MVLHCVLKNAPSLEPYSLAQNYMDRFLWHLAEISKRL